MTSPLMLSIFFQIAGVLVIIAEIVIPSGGLISIIAAALFGYSLYIVYTDVSFFAFSIFAIGDIIMIPALVIIGIKAISKSPVTLKTTLSKEEGVTSQSSGLGEHINKTGIAISDLRPAGMARIEGKRLDVVTRGEYINRDSEIIVISVTGNQIIVRENETKE